MSRAIVLSTFLVVSQLMLSQAGSRPSSPANDVPVISADVGPCSADFTVTSTNSKPIYKAKITVAIKHGFGGWHRTNLEIYTNVDGKARVEGLPAKNKVPLSFDVSYEGRGTSTVVDTTENCHGSFTAVVSDKAVADEKQ